jgi:hypothetical protein
MAKKIRKFSIDVEVIFVYSQNIQKELRILSTMPDEVKGTIFRENRIMDHKLA